MSEDQAGSGSRPVVVSGPIHDRNELKKPTLVDQEIQGNDDHHENDDTNKGDGTIPPKAPRLPPKKYYMWDDEDDNWCSGYDDIFGDECGFCGRGHIIEHCRRYRRQRKLDAQCQARSNSTPLSSKDRDGNNCA